MRIQVLFALITLLVTGCKNDTDNGTSNCIQTPCTEIYVSLTISVVDQDSRPVSFDNYSVLLTENNTDITSNNSDIDSENMKEKGIYPVFSDRYVREYQNKSTEILFTGFIDGVAMASSTFTVGADCCHVKFISDQTTLVIDMAS